jgi:hypothetical protein
MACKTNGAGSSNGVPLGFEAKLWQMPDALRNNMDAAGVQARRPRTKAHRVEA